MSHSVVLAVVMVFAEIKSESTEDFYAPSTLVFHDIYATATRDDPTSSTVTEDYNISRKRAPSVEFHILTTTEKSNFLPPKYLIDPVIKTTVATTTTTTTEDPENTIKVVPVKKNYQRGLLDLLFPPKRVKTFKSMFDSIRKVLSHTFRR